MSGRLYVQRGPSRSVLERVSPLLRLDAVCFEFGDQRRRKLGGRGIEFGCLFRRQANDLTPVCCPLFRALRQKSTW